MRRHYFPRHCAILLTITLTALLPPLSAEQTQICPPGDVDGDCYVDLNDLAIVAHNWLAEGITCDSGYLDCDDLYENGCEVNADTDLNNCGHCGQVCSFPHGAVTCVAGVCTHGDCDPGWTDCDGNDDNGCETPLLHTTTCSAAQSLSPVIGNLHIFEEFVGCMSTDAVGPSRTGIGSKWYVITVQDNGASSYCPGMLLQAELLPPAGVNYDLFFYTTCSGGPVASSTSPAGLEELAYFWDSGNRNLWIEVRYISADNPAGQCSNWQLQTYAGDWQP